MARIKLQRFGGLRPKRAAHLLAEHEAQTATNCDLADGTLAPIPPTDTPTGSWASIFLYHGDTADTWLRWTTDVDVVQSPVSGDQYHRVYYTGDGVPKVRSMDTAEVFSLAIPAPATAPFIDTSGTAGGRIVNPFSLWSVGAPWCQPYRDTANTWVDTTSSNITTSTVTCTASATTQVDVNTWRIERTYELASYGSDTYFFTTVGVTSGGVKWHMEHEEEDPSGSGFKVRLTTNTNATGKTDSIFVASGTEKTVTVAGTITLTYTPVSDTQYYRYVATYVSAWGEEGPPSTPSDIVTCPPGTRPEVSKPTGNPGRNITKVRLYRSVAGETTDTYKFCAELGLSTPFWTDYLPDTSLGETLPSPSATGPDDDLAGLICCPGGFLGGFKDKTVYFSSPYLPYSWPTAYTYTVDWDIVGLGVSGNDIVVVTKGCPYIINGSHPERMTVTRLMVNQACVAKRSIAALGSALLYASPDGIVAVEAGSARLITGEHYTRAQWQALTPASCFAATHDGKYYAHFPSTFLVFDTTTGDGLTITTTSATCTALWSDLLTDTLYVGPGTAYGGQEWAELTAPVLTWKSKEFVFPTAVTFGWCRVIADEYLEGDSYATSILTLTVYCASEAADDTTATTYSQAVLIRKNRLQLGESGDLRPLAGSAPRRFAPLPRARRWWFTVASKKRVTEVTLAGTIDELNHE